MDSNCPCVLLFLLVVLVVGPALHQHRQQVIPGSQSGTGQVFRAPTDYEAALHYAETSPINVRQHTGGYHRDSQFGDWHKQEGACRYATTRDLILQCDLTNVRSKGCKVQSGDFQDPYTARTVHFIKGPETSPQVQIDHIVSSTTPGRRGRWRRDRAGERADYYNDPDVLQAADGSSNQDKGDGIDWHATHNLVWMSENR